MSRIFFLETQGYGQALALFLASATAVEIASALRSRDLSRTEIPV
jgi:hypothetical protein